jgi:TonB-linked SusC/RagA family outer membrane protein
MNEILNYMNRISSLIKLLSVVLILLVTQNLQARTNSATPGKIVKGIVRDAHTHAPIAAARISMMNKKNTTTTDNAGHFKLEVSSDKELLQVEAFDYLMREIALKSQDSIVIELYADDFEANYKMLEGANGSVSKTLNTGSLATNNTINSFYAFTADELLPADAAVKSSSRSGQIGQGASLFIRGLNSVNANAQPLYVIDGVIWNSMYDVNSIHDGYSINPLTNIDMNDIESISVLKDATSIYGSKAANGVVFIKTNRSLDMTTKINLNISTGYSLAPKALPVMGNAAYKVYLTDVLGTMGLSNTEINALPYLNDDPARFTYPTYHNNTNWQDEIYNNAFSKSYSINVKGGDQKALYYFSLGYTGNDGVVKTTNLDRYNMRYNGDINLFKSLKLGVNVNFMRIDRKMVDDGMNIFSSPTWISKMKAPFLSPYNYTFMGERTTELSFADALGISNPLGAIEMSNNSVKQNNFNVTLRPVYTISKSLNITNTFDYSFNKLIEDRYRPYLYTAPMPMNSEDLSYNTRENQVIRNNAIFNDFRVNYEKNLTQYLDMKVFAGTRFLLNRFESDFVQGHNSMSNTSTNLYGSFKNISADGVNNDSKSISNYVNAEVNYDNRYILTVNAAMDASSRFGNEIQGRLKLFGQSWGIFPSVNAAWLMSSESFMKNLNFVNLLKWRVGYGITGNDNIPDYQTLAYFSSIRFKGVSNGTTLAQLANPSIQWETTNRANIGLDFNLFNERVSVSVDAYSSLTNNLLIQKQLPDVAGLKSYWTNSGSLTNKGIEASLSAKLLNFKNFYWELGASVGHYANSIKSLPNGEFITPVLGGEVLTREGNAAGVFYGYKFLGVFATENEAATAYNNMYMVDGHGNKFGAGDARFQDVNNDGVINESDKQIIGNPNPAVYGTLSSKISLYNFTLSALFSYSYGNQIYNYQRSQLEAGATIGNQSTAMERRWISEGMVTNQPKAIYGDPMGNSRFSDRWIEDGSYLRLKSVSISYEIPVKKSFLEAITIWASANNLLTFSNYLGSDPEFSYGTNVLVQGVDAGLLPLNKSYNLGLKINL